MLRCIIELSEGGDLEAPPLSIAASGCHNREGRMASVADVNRSYVLVQMPSGSMKDNGKEPSPSAAKAGISDAT